MEKTIENGIDIQNKNNVTHMLQNEMEKTINNVIDIQNKNNLHIEGFIRHQDNIKTALSRYGIKFEGKFIKTKYFASDDNHQTKDLLVQTLVCRDDETLVLGKPRFPIKYDFCQVKLVKVGPYDLGSKTPLAVEVIPFKENGPKNTTKIHNTTINKRSKQNKKRKINERRKKSY